MLNSNEVRILLALPSFGHPRYKTLQSMVKYAGSHKYKTLFHFIENTVIHQARNKSVYTAVEQQCTHLLFIDDDMVFEPGAVEQLIEADKDIIGALCYGRKGNQDYPPRPVIKKIEDGDLTDMTIFEIKTWDKPFKVDATGTGFLLIKTDVFKKIDPPFFYFADPKDFGFPSLPFPENSLGEDVSFMMKARQAGYEIWVDPTIPIGHIGEKSYKKEDIYFGSEMNTEVTDRTAIFIPTVKRPHLIGPLIESIRLNTPEPHRIYIMTKDEETIKIANSFPNVTVFVDKTDDIRYTTRMHYMLKKTTEPFIFTGSDDISFRKGWLSSAMNVMKKVNGVVAVNDMHNPLGTNFLISREYIDKQSGCLDIKNVIFYPGYLHNFCDTELISVAKIRNKYAKAQDAIVEHHHWRSGHAKRDETYQWADERFLKDQGTFLSRKQKLRFPAL